MVKFCKSPRCLTGKTAIITGANAGIGYETALEFAKRGCRVIMACRSQERANAARNKLIAATGNNNIAVKLIDLESFESVRTFAKDINLTEERLDILVNNAGAGYLENRQTKDGNLLEMQVNYFSPFLLTNLLLDLLKRSAPSRIVNVSSNAAQLIHSLKLEELNKHTGNNNVYARTKLCQILFTQELARRLAASASGVTTYSLHPGVVHTEFQRFSNTLNFIARNFFKSPEEGAQTSIFLAIQPEIEALSGQHFHDSEPVKAYCGARDDAKAKDLWEISEDTVGVNANAN